MFYYLIIIFTVFQLLFIDTLRLFAQENTFKFKGYLKNIQSVSFVDNTDSVTTMSLIHNRLNLHWSPSKKIYTVLEIRNRLFYGEIAGSIENFSNYVNQQEQLVDMSVILVDEKSVLLHSVIDRLWIGYIDKNWDIKIGRQRVNWGINLAWNPNDIFNTYNILDFDYEEMPGIDAIRVQYYTGLFANFDFAVKPARESRRLVAALKFGFNKWGYDYQLLGGLFHDDIVIGAGWAGNISGAGFKGEVSYFKPRINKEQSREALILSPSVDYSFNNGLYLNTSFLYSSAAKNDINEFIYNSNQILNPKNLMPARFSFLLQGNYGFTPIFSSNLTVIYSPGIHTLIIFPGIYYSISNDWDLALVAQSFWAKKDERFKTLGNSIFLRIRLSF